MQHNQVLDNPLANPIEIGWLVGMIEGEGSVIMTLTNNRRQILSSVVFTNTDRDIVKRYLSILNALDVAHHVHVGYHARNHFGKRERTDISIFRYAALRKLIDAIYPHMTDGIKKHRLEFVSRFIDSRMQMYSQETGSGKHSSRGITNDARKYTADQWAIYDEYKATFDGKASESKGLAPDIPGDDVLRTA
jgi:hypothetical protein